jgi:hypothetical protein
MKNIAEKYGMNYVRKDGTSKIQDLLLPELRENVISGKVKGRDVLIYDYTTTLVGLRLPHYSRYTVIKIDGIEKKKSDFWETFAKIKEVDNAFSFLLG